MKRILVTGSTGCIGSATVQYLLNQGVERVYGYNRTAPKMKFSDRFEHLSGDIKDINRIRDVLREIQPHIIIHLAALQTPDCQSSPFLGMDVNLVSTANLFKVVAEESKVIERFVFASSAAVHGPRSCHPEGLVSSDALFSPPNLYGFWKLAGEGMAQAFHMETEIPTVSLRLGTTYGPGRDRGLTSAPTTAMKACVLGIDYEIPYRGREHYHFVEDVGAGFAESAISPFEGYGAFHLTGQTIMITEFCETIHNIAMRIGIENPGKPEVKTDAPLMPFTFDLDHHPTLQSFPRMTLTPIKKGIQKTIEFFQEQVVSGELYKIIQNY